ncbi:patatin-like phospholipase family protein [Azospirillum cavernae]|nr:patatin-like phospholipase family protein [Azospirillum cavernae]
MSQVAASDWDHWFPNQRDKPDPGVFEIGLVLAGAISGGAYSAGVIDSLVEALDRWEAEKAKGDPDIPNHTVVLRVIAGASAGGMVGAIAGVALKYDFPHVSPAAPYDDKAADKDRNPLYRAWVKGIDIAPLLGATDLRDGRVPSLLDCAVLSKIAGQAVDYRGPPPPKRSWLPDALPVLLAVTNLRGVPYRLHHRGAPGFGHDMLMHRDHMAFLLTGLGDTPAYSMPTPPSVGGYVTLSGVNDSAKPEWKGLVQAALATGAFPLALAPRPLERWIGDYDCRLPGGAERDKVANTMTPLTPSWPPNQPPLCKFLCVDGGVMDNEPFELARMTLAGAIGFNPRKGEEANRAVVMIDPFCEPDGFGPEDDSRPLTDVAKALFSAMKNQARFKPSELDLAMNDDVYSRFLIAPSRDGARGARAIASGALGSFLGFFSEAYRHHDYMLGRKNARNFLRHHFALPESNPLFTNTWSDTARTNFAVPDDPTHLPIIPLFDQDEDWKASPSWPAGALSFAEGDPLDRALVARIDAVYAEIQKGLRNDARATTGDWWAKLKARAGVETGIGWFAIAWNVPGGIRAKLLETARAQIAAAIADINTRTFPGEQA